MLKFVFSIDGMRCGMCEAHVKDAIRRCGGVRSVKASCARGEASAVADGEEAEESIRRAIEAQGYRVRSVTRTPYEKRGLFGRLKQ